MRSIFSLLFIYLSSTLWADTVKPVEVTDQTVKIKGKDSLNLYFGFAEGDVIVFSFELEKGKSMGEIEITSWPNTVKFSDYESKGTTQKHIKVNKTGVYAFNFKNTALFRRVAHIEIQRIPASDETANFNTAVKWVKENDTTFYTEEMKIEVSDTSIVSLVDRVQKVPPKTKFKGNENTFNFKLPANTVAWSYYIGVDQEGQEAYQTATEKLAIYATPVLSKIPTYGPLAALALHGVSYFTKLQDGEDIQYYIVPDGQEKRFLQDSAVQYLKKGTVINDFSKVTRPTTGNYHFCLRNDNLIRGVQVTIKAVAITVKKYWTVKQVQKFTIEERLIPKVIE